MKKSSGFSLTEILLGLLLSSFILAALLTYYLGSKQQFIRLQAELEDAFEMLLITDLIQGSVRKAGFTPCLRVDYLTTAHPGLRPLQLVDPHTLQVNRMSEYFGVVEEILTPTEIKVRSLNIKPQQFVLIADCYYGEVKQVQSLRTQGKHQTIVLKEPLMFTYHSPVYVGEWLQEKFFIQNKPQKTSLLYRLKHTDELTTAVKKIHFSVQENFEQILLQTDLELNNGKRIILQTTVRT
ncbi:hypothetical protein [Legionella septentrionalis]|uniref:hypothetical protein n=1 Tax=Legionella septentrionalis TaxID=2498109 RepID=UPI000F8E6ECF|nr:hypothetical protein [Legionella septentrionalis]RUQ96867.1 hypothetical protein ELY11_07105 [Legionella septentrionalis]RUR10933.1 hypothetical protein ELY14_03780 [Legionella septentrionalis]